MAIDGKDRPNKSRLGVAFINYISPSSRTYDKFFTKLIKKLRPDWFETNIRSKTNKEYLINIAKNGEDKPHYKTKLGSLFKNYIYKSESSYDPVFTKLIKKIRPDWFVKSSDVRKKILIQMAKNKKDRPNQKKTKLGKSLTSYTMSGQCYDSAFTKLIINLRPDWFN